MIPTLKPTPKQHKAWTYLKDAVTSVLFFGGGAGGGKSWLGCEWIITNSYMYPDSKWFIARKELKRLMLSTYVTFSKVLKHHGIPATDFHLDGRLNVLTNRITGAKIDLLDASWRPMEDPLFERFGSLEYTGGWSEEGPELKFGAFEVLNSRIGRHLNKELGLLPPKHLVTGNPSKGWPYKFFYRPKKDGTLPREYAFVQSLWSDNPFTADEYGKQLAMIRDKAQRERLMNGNWEYDDDPATLIDYDALLDMFKLPREKEGVMRMTVDAARLGGDRIVLTVWRGLSAIKIVVKNKQKLNVTATNVEMLADEFGITRSNILFDEDGVGGGLVDFLPGTNGFVANSKPITDPGNTDVDGKEKRPNFRNLKAQCAYLLADYINDRRISAAGRTPEREMELTEELEQIRAKAVDKDAPLDLVPKEEVKEAIGRSPDLSDTFIMRMWFELKRVKPKHVVTQTTPSWASRKWNKRQ